MKISLLSNDIELHEGLEQTGYFQVEIKSNLTDIEKNEVIIISDSNLNHNQLIEEVDTGKKRFSKHIFYIINNTYSEQELANIVFSSKARNITIIPPKLTTSQKINRILEKLIPNLNENGRNIITFFGADSKVGTTMIAQSTAEFLAKNSTAEIGLLFLNGSPSNYYFKNKENLGLDDIKIKLFNNILNLDELVETCYRAYPNLFVLQGNEQILDIRQYHPEHIDWLIKLASQKFNLLIIDAGSNIDSGMAIASLNATKNKYLVTTQQEIARKNFERIERQIFKSLQIKPNDFMLIVNKYLKTNNIYNATQLANIYKMTLATYIPNMDLLGWQAEYDQKNLLHYGSNEFSNQIEIISKLIAVQANISFNPKVIKTHNPFKKAIGSLGGYF